MFRHDRVFGTSVIGHLERQRFVTRLNGPSPFEAFEQVECGFSAASGQETVLAQAKQEAHANESCGHEIRSSRFERLLATKLIQTIWPLVPAPLEQTVLNARKWPYNVR